MKTKLICYLRGHRWENYQKSGGHYTDRRGNLRHRIWYYSRCLRCGWNTNDDPYVHELKADWAGIVFRVKNFIRGLLRKPPKDDIPF